MKRTTILGLTTLLILAALLPASATAAKKKPKPKSVNRTVEFTYEEASGVYVNGLGGAAPSAAVTIPTEAAELLLSFAVTDDSGQKVGGRIAQNVDGEFTANDNMAAFCGSIEKAPITGGYPVYVYLTVGTCGTEVAPSTPTSGKLVATLATQ